MHRCPSPCCHTPAAFALLPCFFLRIPILSCSFCPSFDVLLLLHVLRCSAYAAHSPMLCSCRISSDVLPHISLLHPSYSTVKFDNKSNPSKKCAKKRRLQDNACKTAVRFIDTERSFLSYPDTSGKPISARPSQNLSSGCHAMLYRRQSRSIIGSNE